MKTQKTREQAKQSPDKPVQKEAYFFTKEWQEREAQADRDIENGDLIGPFDNVLAFREFFQVVDELREKVKDADPEELDAAIEEAVATAKRATARDLKRRLNR